jgi:hypothetical protein
MGGPVFLSEGQHPRLHDQACEFRDNIFAYREIGAVILRQRRRRGLAQGVLGPAQPAVPDPALIPTRRRRPPTHLTTHPSIGEFARRDTFIIDPQAASGKLLREGGP